MTVPPRRVRGRLAPEAMFPAGLPGIRVRMVALPDGMVLRVAESGDAAAPPVVLLHGWGASVYMWRDWFAPLAAAGWRAVAVDLPGHGLSSKPTTRGAYTLEQQVRVLRELFDAERLGGAPVVAQSMAGTIALELAMATDSPVGRLALVNPAIFGRVRLQRLGRLVSPALVDPVLGYAVPRWIVQRAHRTAYADGSRVTHDDVEQYWAASQDPDYARAMRRLLHEFQWRRPPVAEMAARLSAMRERALVLLGGQDRIIQHAMPYAAALRAAGAPIDVAYVPQGGHAMNEETPALVLPAVLRHLSAQAAG